VKKFSAIGALLIAVIMATIWWLGTAFIAPTPHRVSKPSGFNGESVRIDGGNHTVAGWWSDAGPTHPVVLLLHGIRADRTSMVPRARLLQAEGFSTLLIDLQAHGETPGKEITLGWREAADVDAALNWISARRPGSAIGVIGCSLGGAAFLYANGRGKPAAVVLEAVYPRLDEAIENRLRTRVGGFARFLTPLLTAQIPLRLGMKASQLEPIRYASGVKGAVLIVAGAKDRYTTLAESRELYDAMPLPRDLWIVPAAGHEDFLARDRLGYGAHVISFLRTHLVRTSLTHFLSNAVKADHAKPTSPQSHPAAIRASLAAAPTSHA
jgi:alpha-beta hydrolase superfamily lysophospholipase